MENLIPAILRRPRDHEYVVYCRREIPAAFQPFRHRVTFRVCPFRNRKLCEQLSIPLFARRDRLDLLHMCWCRPYLYRGRCVFNIMGLEWRTHPDVPLHSRLNTWYYRTTIESTCRRADRLIAISRFMKETFVERMSIPPEKIDVVYLGVNLDTFRRIEDTAALEAVRTRYGLDGRFILFVGAMLANKNLPNLMRAFARLRQRPDCGDLRLVIAGGRGWNSSPLADLVQELALEDRVVFTGFVPEEDKVALYNLAHVYAFPSFVEGFGLPVLEAFACGTPVVTSNVTAMPEVAGDAALLIDPHSVEELEEALHRACTDEAERKRMVEGGLQRAGEFTWERTADAMLDVYERAAGGNG